VGSNPAVTITFLYDERDVICMSQDHVTYGDSITVGGGYPMKVDDADVAGELKLPGLRIWGHRIILDGEDGIKCAECDMEEEIPDLIQATTGFREVLYKLYLLRKFKDADCDSLPVGTLIEDGSGNNRVRYDPSTVNWSSGKHSGDYTMMVSPDMHDDLKKDINRKI
jgi:hypothetical protein